MSTTTIITIIAVIVIVIIVVIIITKTPPPLPSSSWWSSWSLSSSWWSSSSLCHQCYYHVLCLCQRRTYHRCHCHVCSVAQEIPTGRPHREGKSRSCRARWSLAWINTARSVLCRWLAVCCYSKIRYAVNCGKDKSPRVAHTSDAQWNLTGLAICPRQPLTWLIPCSFVESFTYVWVCLFRLSYVVLIVCFTRFSSLMRSGVCLHFKVQLTWLWNQSS